MTTDWRIVAIRWVGVVALGLALLGLFVRGPEATLDWVLARLDVFIAWITGR